MSGPTVAAVAPDGTPITLPQEKVGELDAAGGHTISAEEAARDEAAIAQRNAPAPGFKAGVANAAEGQVAGVVGYHRGFGEAFGVPVDAAATGIAGILGGENAKAQTRDYLKGLDERHPIESGGFGLIGNVGGSIAAAEALGAPGAVSKPAVAGLRGFAGRAAMAGVENVIQSSTKDVNEAALGNSEVNGLKIVAAAPDRFVMGAAIGGAFELGAHGIGAASRAFVGKAAPALEEGASAAVGREVGDEAAGARIRALAGGEVPTSRAQIADLLAGEQAAQRGRAVAERASTLDALAGTQATEAASMAARHEAGREGVLVAGKRAVGEAEKVGAESTLDAMARGGARVEEAELAAGARRAAAPAALHEEVAAAGRTVDQIAEHYNMVRQPLVEEHAAVMKVADEIAAERAANARELGEVLAKNREAGHTPNSISPSDFDEMVDTYLGITGHRGDPATRWAAEEFLRKEYGNALSESAVTEASGEHIDRLKKLADQLEAAHNDTLSHASEIAKTIANVDKEAGKHIAQVGRAADARIAAFQAAEGKATAKAEGAIETARTAGQKEAAAAQKKASLGVESAREQAGASHAKFEKGAEAEKASMAKLHEKQIAKVPEASTVTDVDPLIEGMKKPIQETAPLVTGQAGLGAGLSLLHGNPVAAGLALASSFAAGRVRAMNNLTRARVLRGMAEQITKVDNAIRDGAALILGRAGARATSSEVSRPPRLPPFEKVAENLMATQGNPDLVEQQVRASLGDTANHAPETYKGALQTAQLANAYLLEVLPQPQRDPHSLTPQLDHGEVNETDQWEFMQTYKTILDPLGIFKDVHDGSATEQQVEAIGRVYAPLLDQMREEVNVQKVSLTRPVDYDRAIHVGTLLGVMTDEVLERDFQSMQFQNYKQKAQQGQAVGSKAGASKTTKNMQSGSESIESGDNP